MRGRDGARSSGTAVRDSLRPREVAPHPERSRTFPAIPGRNAARSVADIRSLVRSKIDRAGLSRRARREAAACNGGWWILCERPAARVGTDGPAAAPTTGPARFAHDQTLALAERAHSVADLGLTVDSAPPSIAPCIDRQASGLGCCCANNSTE